MSEFERPIEWAGQPGQGVDIEGVRGHLGMAADWSVVQSTVDDRITLLFSIPPGHNKSLRGSLAAYTTVRIPDEEAFHQACEDAWAEAAGEGMRALSRNGELIVKEGAGDAGH